MLSDRQKLILSAIVDDYIRSAEPVGSRSISKRGSVAYSPATIRNEMSDLEVMGFLEQPHTSAGRIPSHKGYRYYVDHLLELSNASDSRIDLKLFFAEKIQELEQVFQQAALILSQLTNYTSIVLGPELISTTLRHLQLIPLNDRSAVAIIVTNTGHVENKAVTIPEGVSIRELEKFVAILNAKLSGVSLLSLKSKLYNEIGNVLSSHLTKYEQLIRMLDDVLETDQEGRLYMSGATNMLTQPEFKDVDKVKSIFDLFDETHTLARMFVPEHTGIQVRIGTENRLEAMNNCSLVTATYSIDGEPLGTIGILGPTRMEYGKVIRLLSQLTQDLAIVLKRWYN